MKNLLVLVITLLFFNNSLIAQDSTNNSSNKLVIGITEAPPFVTENQKGQFSGLSIASWKLVNKELNKDFKYKKFETLTDLLAAIKSKEVDFSINPITVTDNRMKSLDFSQPYFISHTGIAKKQESQVWNILKNLWSWQFISAIFILLGIIFIFGFLVWVFERKRNSEEFGDNARGILQGFWWSAVTMTTVGYGDKSPQTFGGRLIGLLWMFIAIIMISSLTASIASSLTVKTINEKISSVEDLENFKVSTVNSSSAAELLDLYSINSKKVTNERVGIEQVAQGKIDLFVYDAPILKYEINRRNLGDELEVLPKTLKKDYYSYCFPKGSKLVLKIDPVLIGTLKSMEWNSLVAKYE